MGPGRRRLRPPDAHGIRPLNGWPVARLAGVEIRVHWTWIGFLALIVVFTASWIEAIAPDLGSEAQWGIGALVAAGFMASATAHDLAHAVISRRRGLAVDAIAVSFFGGSSPLETGAGNPADEVAIAVAGPLTSLTIGSLMVAAGLGLMLPGGPLLEATGLCIASLGGLNLFLGAVNFLPAYPLDGGRLFRALIWRRTGDERRGTRFVGRAGNVIGLLLIGAGLALTFYDDVGNGLMVVLAGWFLRLTARGAMGHAELEDVAAGIRAGDVMEPVGTMVSAGLTVDTFAAQVLDGETPRSVVLVGQGDDIQGLVGVSQLRRLPRKKWPETRVEDVMVPRSRLTPVSPDDPIWPILLRLRDEGIDGLPVVVPPGERLSGLVTGRGIAQAIRARQSGPGRRRWGLGR